MLKFSANHLFLLSRTDYASCAVLVMLDNDTKRVYRLFDFTKRLRLLSRLCLQRGWQSEQREHTLAGDVGQAGHPTSVSLQHSSLLQTAREGRTCVNPAALSEPDFKVVRPFCRRRPAHQCPLPTKPVHKPAAKPVRSPPF
jgi:hypothetical protein